MERVRKLPNLYRCLTRMESGFAYRPGRKFNHRQVRVAVAERFSYSKQVGRGAFKTVFRVEWGKRTLIVKVGAPQYITADREAYRRMRKVLRGVGLSCYARIFWFTKFFEVQEVADVRVLPPKKVVEPIRDLLYTNGLADVRPCNFGVVRGEWRIIDISTKEFMDEWRKGKGVKNANVRH